ncbi:transcription termination/antitermination protein NusG [Haliovirga abyssi]|uniref:Transcription termination/antitermination protein NusG n=1 Tax=Haliovirga abyssi TaxID=2996794 RepID=A0AAU9DVA6_9FUSO|nr:transcription termination/antitermination protein NusG [Haliovirga abyssi]BDU51294.1 transcription termination/antitermination protein NusG [Haliovirga abyssi]
MAESQNFVKKWYIIHTYSGYEKKVKTDLEKRVESLNFTDKVFRIIVPEEEKIEMVRGKKKKVARKLFPGYVMVEMLVKKEETLEGIGHKVDSDVWYVIRNTAGVTGFVGIGAEPIPLEDEEAVHLLRKIGIIEKSDKNKGTVIELPYKVNEKVKIIEGPFENSIGEVASIDYEHKKVKVMIDIFGRMTPTEVGFEGVDKL